MELIVYDNFSKKRNSTKQPAGGTAYDIKLKNPCSTINPVFLIEGVNLNANYCKWNGRYYYIDNIVLRNNNIYELHCSVDTLATYKSQIGASSQYVVRASAEYDGYVQDNMYPTKAKYQTFAGAVNTLGNFTTAMTAGTYVVGIATGGKTAGAASYYAFNYAQFNNFFSKLLTDIDNDFSQVEDITDLELMTLRSQINPMQYITSCKWFPFDVPTVGSVGIIDVGFWHIIAGAGVIGGGTAYTASGTYTLGDHPQAETRGKFLNAAPYTNTTIKFLPFGSFNIDNSVLIDDTTIGFNLKVDCCTGKGVFEAYTNASQPVLLFTSSAQIGVDIPITQIISTNWGNMIAGGVSSLSGIVGIAMGNVGGIGSVLNGIGNMINSIVPTTETRGNLGSTVDFDICPFPIVYTKRYMLVDDDLSDRGRPLCKIRTLSALGGFIMCADAHIDITGTPAEKAEINSYLESGFFYE